MVSVAVATDTEVRTVLQVFHSVSLGLLVFHSVSLGFQVFQSVLHSFMAFMAAYLPYTRPHTRFLKISLSVKVTFVGSQI